MLNMNEKYSIWALSNQSTEQELSQIINFLSNKYGGPIFFPHLTLVGGINKDKKEIFKATDMIASDIDNLKLTLGETSFGTTFFQSVFVRVKASASLMRQNIRAREVLSIGNDMYMPHVSLLYGNHNMKIREEATQQINLQNRNFNIEKLVVVLSSNDPDEWKILHQANLNK